MDVIQEAGTELRGSPPAVACRSSSSRPASPVSVGLIDETGQTGRPLEIGEREAVAQAQRIQHELEWQVFDRHRPASAGACGGARRRYSRGMRTFSVRMT